MDRKEFRKAANRLAGLLEDIPREWDGKESIRAMKEGGSSHWRKMEWMGYYFEFLCESILSPVVSFEQDDLVSYGRTQFDGFFRIPWDCKTHATRNHANVRNRHVVLNSKKAIEHALREYGSVGLIVAVGDVEYNDEEGDFYRWHRKMKGGRSPFEKDRAMRGAPSRRRKTTFTLLRILFIHLDKGLMKHAESFQKGYRNADGSLREEKVRIDLKTLPDDNCVSVDFGA